MKTEFKVGDRVAVYGSYLHCGNHVGSSDTKSEGVVQMVHSTFLQLTIGCANPKQCRKLKPSRLSRRIWLNLAYDWGSIPGVSLELPDKPEQFACFRAERRK